MAEMMRLNTRITTDINEWLDNRSEESGIPKSTLILLALEQYIQQHEAANAVKDMESFMGRLEKLLSSAEKQSS